MADRWLQEKAPAQQLISLRHEMRQSSALQQLLAYPDLSASMLLALILAISAPFPLRPALLDASLGVLFMFYIPGYVLLAALFPWDGDLHPIQRQALIVIINLALTPMLAYLLYTLPIGLALPGWKLATAFATLFLAGVAFWRRQQIGAEAQGFPAMAGWPAQIWQAVHADSKSTPWTAAAWVAGIVLLASGIYAGLTVQAAGDFTEFYVDPALSTQISTASNAHTQLALQVVNQEGRRMDYIVEQQIANGAPSIIARFSLEAGQIKQVESQPISRHTTATPVTFMLYVDNAVDKGFAGWLRWLLDNRPRTPYRHLELWV